MINMTPEYPHAGGMKSHYPYCFTAFTNYPVHSLPHFSGSFVGKGYGHDIEGIDPALLYHMSDAVSKNPGLSRSRTGYYELRSLQVTGRLILSFI